MPNYSEIGPLAKSTLITFITRYDNKHFGVLFSIHSASSSDKDKDDYKCILHFIECIIA